MGEKVYCLMGPTASGKTALACELVTQFPFEIISVDSGMIYREMDIGTAKPSEAILRNAPHHLINIINPDESYSAALFKTDIIDIIEAIRSRGKWPLLVGGTMMYFNILQRGLFYLPESNPKIRQELEEEANKLGSLSLYKSLTQVDKTSAERLHPHDTTRIIRALEVFEITGQPLSVLQESVKKPEYDFVNILLFPTNRSWLHQRIAYRFTEMLRMGLVEEVRKLLTKWSVTNQNPSMRMVGYRQVIQYLNNQLSKDDLVNKGIASTRQLAKRQLTWLKTWPQPIYLDPESDFLIEKIKKII